MRKSIAVILVALAGTLATPAFAITGNWVDDIEHPFVGLVVFYDSSGEFIWRCSGSLMSPTKFVTAGHCADTAEGAATARVYFQQDAGQELQSGDGRRPRQRLSEHLRARHPGRRVRDVEPALQLRLRQLRRVSEHP